MYTDETLKCVDCNASFAFTAGDQDFYATKGFTNKPSRCPDCRAARKAQRGGNAGGSRPQRQMFQATCSNCGNVAELPFQPRGDRPVYCRECFSQQKGSVS